VRADAAPEAPPAAAPKAAAIGPPRGSKVTRPLLSGSAMGHVHSLRATLVPDLQCYWGHAHSS
jgi:hypothetical protein